MVRQPGDPPLGQLALGNIRAGADVAAIGTPFVEHRLARQPPPAFRARRRDTQLDILERPVSGDVALQMHHQRVIRRRDALHEMHEVGADQVTLGQRGRLGEPARDAVDDALPVKAPDPVGRALLELAQQQADDLALFFQQRFGCPMGDKGSGVIEGHAHHDRGKDHQQDALDPQGRRRADAHHRGHDAHDKRNGKGGKGLGIVHQRHHRDAQQPARPDGGNALHDGIVPHRQRQERRTPQRPSQTGMHDRSAHRLNGPLVASARAPAPGQIGRMRLQQIDRAQRRHHGHEPVRRPAQQHKGRRQHDHAEQQRGHHAGKGIQLLAQKFLPHARRQAIRTDGAVHEPVDQGKQADFDRNAHARIMI